MCVGVWIALNKSLEQRLWLDFLPRFGALFLAVAWIVSYALCDGPIGVWCQHSFSISHIDAMTEDFSSSSPGTAMGGG